MQRWIERLGRINIDAPQDVQRYQYGRFGGFVGILVNGMIFVIECIVGLMTGSIAMISDAVHNVTDVGGSLLSWLSFAISRQGADEEHPYGHGRYEQLLSIGFSIVLFVLAAQLARESYDRIVDPTMVEVTKPMMAVMALAMVFKFMLSRFLNFLGKSINSPILVANSKDAMSDVFATAAILIGLFVGAMWHVDVDGYLGAIVSLMIAHAGFEVLRDSTNRILGKVPSREYVQEIKNRIKKYPGVLGVHDLMIHDYGPGHEYASVHVEMDASTAPLESHTLLDEIERDLHEHMGLVLTTHLDPIVNDKETAFWHKRLTEFVHVYSKQYEVHDVRCLPDVNGKNRLEFTVIIPAADSKKAQELQDMIGKTVSLMAPNYAIQMRVGLAR